MQVQYSWINSHTEDVVKCSCIWSLYPRAMLIAHLSKKRKYISLSIQVLHLILCEEMTQIQAKKSRYFQFLSHKVPINFSQFLGLRKRNKAYKDSFP